MPRIRGLGQRPNFEIALSVVFDCACVERSQGGAVAEPPLRSVGVRDKNGNGRMGVECSELRRYNAERAFCLMAG